MREDDGVPFPLEADDLSGQIERRIKRLMGGAGHGHTPKREARALTAAKPSAN